MSLPDGAVKREAAEPPDAADEHTAVAASEEESAVWTPLADTVGVWKASPRGTSNSYS